MRAYAEEGLSIVKVLPEPPNKFYDIIDKGLLVISSLIILIFIFHKYINEYIFFFFVILTVVYYLIYFFYVRLGNVLEVKI